LQCFQQEIENRNLFGKVLLGGSTCLGPCSWGPTVVIYPEGTWYGRLKTDDIPEIVEKHIINGEPVERLVMPEGAWG
jgi:(2Fe-2S) ferredoxin